MQTKIHLDMLIRKQADIWQAEDLTWWYAMMTCRHAEMAEADMQTGWNADILNQVIQVIEVIQVI